MPKNEKPKLRNEKQQELEEKGSVVAELDEDILPGREVDNLRQKLNPPKGKEQQVLMDDDWVLLGSEKDAPLDMRPPSEEGLKDLQYELDKSAMEDRLRKFIDAASEKASIEEQLTSASSLLQEVTGIQEENLPQADTSKKTSVDYRAKFDSLSYDEQLLLFKWYRQDIFSLAIFEIGTEESERIDSVLKKIKSKERAFDSLDDLEQALLFKWHRQTISEFGIFEIDQEESKKVNSALEKIKSNKQKFYDLPSHEQVLLFKYRRKDLFDRGALKIENTQSRDVNDAFNKLQKDLIALKAIQEIEESSQGHLATLLCNKLANLESKQQDLLFKWRRKDLFELMDSFKAFYNEKDNTYDRLDNTQQSIIYYSSRSSEALRFFCTEGKCNIDIQNGDGETALMKAAEYGNFESLKIALDLGANIKKVDQFQENLFHKIAEQFGRRIELVLEHMNIIVHILESQPISTLKLLLEGEAQDKAKNSNEKRTPQSIIKKRLGAQTKNKPFISELDRLFDSLNNALTHSNADQIKEAADIFRSNVERKHQEELKTPQETNFATRVGGATGQDRTGQATSVRR